MFMRISKIYSTGFSLVEPNRFFCPSLARLENHSPRLRSTPGSGAFSLVELSIVLVILGLLVGGVLSGQSLIRAAELRRVTSDADRFMAAHRIFQDKYFSHPGDMPNATQFWGVAAGNGANAACRDFVSTGLPTCNGNGDGQIQSDTYIIYEEMRYWQHLANAGLIEGRYTGTYNSSGLAYTPGGNVPSGRVKSSAIWYIYSDAPNEMAVYLMDADDSSRVLKPEEAWNVDTKLDDGIPNRGKVRIYTDTPNTCLNAAETQYQLASTAALCGLILYPYN